MVVNGEERQVREEEEEEEEGFPRITETGDRTGEKREEQMLLAVGRLAGRRLQLHCWLSW